ncbi:MAG: AbrB/MazE/SpoVT family DNA-binding domain-containing protein [Spirochaetaceae bacterium]|nr:MAG: AbrB/MazE/SpoVT family DNA-binding domain-containing protein [Spirochaetaceae bacterium]
MTMRVTEKGQVTIPQSIRVALGINPGTEVEFELQGDHAVVKRIVQPDVVAERLENYAGSADVGMSTDEILALTRR